MSVTDIVGNIACSHMITLHLPSRGSSLQKCSTAFRFYTQQWLLQCPDRGARLKGRDSSKEESEGCVAIVCRDTSKEESDDESLNSCCACRGTSLPRYFSCLEAGVPQ